MDFAIETAQGHGIMTFHPAENIMNNIYLSLMIPKGSCFWNPEFGSRLHELKRSKDTERTRAGGNMQRPSVDPDTGGQNPSR